MSYIAYRGIITEVLEEDAPANSSGSFPHEPGLQGPEPVLGLHTRQGKMRKKVNDLDQDEIQKQTLKKQK